jgi:hypothetical protein
LRERTLDTSSAAAANAAHPQNQAESLLFFSCCSNPVAVQIDSRLHCTYIAIHSWLGGQQWRRRERKQRRRRRPSVGRRSSRRRIRSSTSHVPEIASHEPATFTGGSTISRDGPAPVDGRGRRRDGGASFLIAFNPRGRRRKRRKNPNLTLANTASALAPQPSRRRPRCFGTNS